MARAARLALLTVCAAVALAGCDSSPPPPAGSRFTAETLATQETPPELQFRGELAGKPIHLLMHECKVYKVDSAEGGNVAWTLVLEGDFPCCPRAACARN
ncbi:hypothetical protein WJ971_24940 [Achromobacter xylosoxidans]